MLFSDPRFLFVFLPATLLAFYAVGWASRKAAMAVLILASAAFFTYGNYAAAAVLAASVAANYILALLLLGERKRKAVVVVGLLANVALLAYFKYRGFFLDNLAGILGHPSPALKLFVPLGVSFYTFQKIAFLVDLYRGEIKSFGFLDYLLFSTFFPNVTSGPITRGQEVFPQFENWNTKPDARCFTEGLSIFIVGLAKKVLIADAMAGFAGPVFDAFKGGQSTGVVAAWVAVLAYALQIYYDFSGYSEMALGLAKMVNLRLPTNFNAPYKANSMIGFWARWHMSLSRWLRDYVFLSVGSLYSAPKRLLGVMVTMLLCGLWHGAQWTFVVWGGLHGIYLVVNHSWRAYAENHPEKTAFWTAKKMKPLGRLITFLAVTLAWVFFRAASLPAAFKMLAAMFGAASLRTGFQLYPAAVVVAVLLYTLKGPDTMAIFSKAHPCLENLPVVRTRLQWKAGFWAAVVIGLLVFLVFRSQMAATESVRFTYTDF